MKSVLYGLLVLSSILACRPQTEQIGEIVKTERGAIGGTFNSDTGVYAFKGIPFAKAPVDSLRWRPPQPVVGWEDTLDAGEFGPICVQPDPQPFMMWTQEFIAPGGNISEDCLNLNIWTGEGGADAGRPVIVFIHGGGFSSGSGSVPIYNGERMAQKGVVFVTINYRVGILGLLAHPELTEESPNGVSGNYGLLDQIAALEWVQRNIAKFGGNPGNVTIAGQSAGSFSVNHLVASPLAEGLFHRAIAQSGAALLPSNRISSEENQLEAAEKQGQKIAESLADGTLSGLRQLPADSLLAARVQFYPVVDRYLLPESIYRIFQKGTYNDVPVLTGWNEDEGLYFGQLPSAEAFRKSIEQQFGEYSDEVLELFPADNDSLAGASRLDLNKLLTFGLQSWKWMKMQNETGESPVYMYYFTRDVPHTPEQQDHGAFHTGELMYAYNTLHKSDRPWKQTDYDLADAMSDYWVNFARTGNPNGEGLPRWPACEAEQYRTIRFGDTIEVDTIPSRERLELLDRTFSERMEALIPDN